MRAIVVLLLFVGLTAAQFDSCLNCDKDILIEGSTRWCECCGNNCQNMCSKCIQQGYCSSKTQFCVNDLFNACGRQSLKCQPSTTTRTTPKPAAMTTTKPIAAPTLTTVPDILRCNACDVASVGSDRWCECCSNNCYSSCFYCWTGGFCAEPTNVCRWAAGNPCSSSSNQCKWTNAPVQATTRSEPPTLSYRTGSAIDVADAASAVLEILGAAAVPLFWCCVIVACLIKSCVSEVRDRATDGINSLRHARSGARAPVGTASNNSNIVTTNAAVPSNWFPLVSAEVVATPPDTCAICLGHIHHPAITPCNHFFCQKCLTQLITASPIPYITCPLCRHEFATGEIRALDYGGARNTQNDDSGSSSEQSTASIERKFAQQEAAAAAATNAGVNIDRDGSNSNDSSNSDSSRSRTNSGERNVTTIDIPLNVMSVDPSPINNNRSQHDDAGSEESTESIERRLAQETNSTANASNNNNDGNHYVHSNDNV